MKNRPTKPPLSALLSLLLTSHPGSVISNAPKNDAAKTMNTRKKITFGIQCVASQLKISAVMASPPTSFVIRMITAIGSVYSATMHTPYKAAIRRPRARFPLPFRKNDTVIGIIGNTQGRQQRGESPQDRFDNRAPQRSAADRGVRLQQRLRHRRRIRVRNRIYGRIRCRVGRCHIPGLRNRGRITRSGNRCRRRRRRPSCGRLYGGCLQRNRKSTVGGRQATLVVASHPFHHGFQRRFAARGDPHFLNEFGAFLEITDLHCEQRIVHSYGLRKLFDLPSNVTSAFGSNVKSRRIRAAVVRARIVHVPRFRDPGLKNNPGNPSPDSETATDQLTGSAGWAVPCSAASSKADRQTIFFRSDGFIMRS